jgi:AraC-like DNA-binding protein
MMEHKYYLEPNMTLECLAKKMKMPEYQLSALLNKKVQKNFCDFINYYRTEHAKKLMSSTRDNSYSILDILYDSGFNSKSAFNRCFKKYTGITPSEYRGKYKVIS